MNPIEDTVGKLCGDAFVMGRVYRLLSAKHGTHDFVMVKFPSRHQENRCCAMRITPHGEVGELLFFSSFARDKIMVAWESLAHYYAALYQERGEANPTASPART